MESRSRAGIDNQPDTMSSSSAARSHSERSIVPEEEEEIDLELDGNVKQTRRNEDRVTCSDQSGSTPTSDENSEKIIFGVVKSSADSVKPTNLISNPFNAPNFLPGEEPKKEALKPDLLVMMRPAPNAGGSQSSSEKNALSTGFAASASHPLIQALKDWSYSSFLVNKQRFAEKVLLPLQSPARADQDPHVILKSRDPVLESRIECLKNSREKHEQMERIVERQIIPALDTLSDAFSSLALLLNDLSTPSTTDYSLIPNGANAREVQEEEEEEEDLSRVASANIKSSEDTLSAQYKQLAHQVKVHGAETDKLRAGLFFFSSSLRTLIEQSMKDCLATINELESARIVFDAERNHHHAQLIRIAGAASGEERRQEDERTLDRLNGLEARFEGLKKDVCVKLNFLFFNQEKVMRKESALLSSLLSAYFAPCLTGQPLSGASNSSRQDSNLDLVLRAYSIKVSNGGKSAEGSVLSRAGSKLAAARRSLSIPANLSSKK